MRFFDTNILVYTEDPADPFKQAIARALVQEVIEAGQFVMSTQVMLEFYRVVTRKQLLAPAHATLLLQAWAENPVVGATPDLLLHAFTLQQSRGLSVWDALMVQAALEAGCTILYSEDLQPGARFGPLSIVNPFATAPGAVHEPQATYAVPPVRRKVTRKV